MRHHLILVEGPPCSGKSTISAFVAQALARRAKVRFVDEGSGDHPADYEFHALAPAGLLGPEPRVVSLADCSENLRDRLLPYKIYDGLPWAVERPLMLDRWRQFAREAAPDAVYVFNCVFLQNPMCETMMRFDLPEEVSRAYIGEIAGIIRPLRPAVIYLKNDDIADAVRRAAAERPGWLEAVIDYHANGAYGRRVGAEGLEGYVRCLRERQARELRILAGLGLEHFVADNPQRDWAAARREIRLWLEDQQSDDSIEATNG